MRQALRTHSSLQRWLSLALGLSITLVALWALARAVDWRSALQYIQQVQWPWLLTAMGALFITNFAKSARWRQLFPRQQPLPSHGQTFGALMAGQLLNFTLPFRSGDISRIYFLGRYRGASSSAAAGTIGAEKVLDLIIMGGLFTLILPYFILPAWLEANRNTIWLISLAALGIWLGIILALPHSQRLLDAIARRWPALAWPARVAQGILAGLTALRHRQQLIPVLGWTVLTWVASISATYALLASLALPASLPLAILANIIVQGGLSVPVAPAGVGIFEWLAILALAIAGIPTDQGLAYGLVAHAAVLFYPVVIGIPWLLTRFRTPKAL